MNPLDLLETPLRGLLRFLHTEANLTYGWSIVTLTVIVRLVLLPLAVQQIKGMKKMQIHNPAIQEIRKKYASDKPKQQEEMMRLFKEQKINPLASCLPLLAQFPVFIALYYVLRNSFKTGSSFLDGSPLDFMWVIPNISKHLGEIGSGAFVLVAIYALSQMLSSEVSATPNMSSLQRKLMRFLPLFVVAFVFIYPVPSGLVIYWVTTNLWTCGQMLVIKRAIGLTAAVAGAPSGEGGPLPPRKGRSRTLPQSAAAVVPEPEAAPKPSRTPKRRTGGAPAAPAAETSQGNGAGQRPRRAPRPRRAAPPPEPAAPEATAPQDPTPPPPPDGTAGPDGAPGAGAPDQAAPKSQRPAGDGAQRRQPRARGKGGSSSGRKPPRKRR
ncbi:MAG: YidC/Oxa1 family rane protein insertase [Miltoncostaeaceae bacterium]|nr:YidC/Oxa1 family rane protein insertase [Miltoncostaeaceae bacterium]